MQRRRSITDILAGLIFIVFGAAFGIAATGYEFGTALRMGPGFFPIVLAAALVLLGGAILVKGFAAVAEDGGLGIVAWRAVALLTFAVLFFGATVRGLGLAPALFVTGLVAALASVENSLLQAAAIAAGLTVFCILIFHYALGVAIPLVGPWLGG
jgi:hypothetical protein